MRDVRPAEKLSDALGPDMKQKEVLPVPVARPGGDLLARYLQRRARPNEAETPHHPKDVRVHDEDRAVEPASVQRRRSDLARNAGQAFEPRQSRIQWHITEESQVEIGPLACNLRHRFREPLRLGFGERHIGNRVSDLPDLRARQIGW